MPTTFFQLHRQQQQCRWSYSHSSWLSPGKAAAAAAAAGPAVAAAALRLVLVTLLLAVPGVRGSEGDASETFRVCHASCLVTGCTRTPGTRNTCDIACPASQFFKPPLSLRVMRWDCAADCSYNCMWAIEGPKASAAVPGPVWKYFGKWPFIRVLGAQEAASVVFSLANLAAHVHNLLHYVRHMRRFSGPAYRASPLVSPGAAASRSRLGCGIAAHYPYYWLWLVYGAVNVNAWLWSSVFHCRDTRLTERLDYFSADLTVVVGLAAALVRALQLRSPGQLAVLGLLAAGGLAQHVHHMAFVKFDYGYNMVLCIALGVATAATWVVWVTAAQHPGRISVYQFMLLLHAAMLLEVLDFPPLLGLVDAHALWHAATVPLTYLWYRFVAVDVAWVAGGGAGSGGSSSSSGGGGGGGGHQQLLGLGVLSMRRCRMQGGGPASTCDFLFVEQHESLLALYLRVYFFCFSSSTEQAVL